MKSLVRKNLKSKAEAIRQYIRQQGASLEMQNQAAEIKILGDNPDIKPSGDRKLSLHDERMKLKDLGISEIQSPCWQVPF